MHSPKKPDKKSVEFDPPMNPRELVFARLGFGKFGMRGNPYREVQRISGGQQLRGHRTRLKELINAKISFREYIFPGVIVSQLYNTIPLNNKDGREPGEMHWIITTLLNSTVGGDHGLAFTAVYHQIDDELLLITDVENIWRPQGFESENGGFLIDPKQMIELWFGDSLIIGTESITAESASMHLLIPRRIDNIEQILSNPFQPAFISILEE